MEVIVAPSARRVFTDDEFEEAGARISSDLTEASTVLGIKAPAPKDLLPGRNHLFFSHTIKAQAPSMPLLDEVLATGAALFDYESLADPSTQTRLVAFGEFAGLAGAVDILYGLGQRLLSKGYSTPLLQVAQTYTYPSMDAVLSAVAAAGEEVATRGLPAAVCPLVVAVTGSGNAARGALRVLRHLPHKLVAPSELPALHERGADPEHRRVVYVCQVQTQDMVERIAPGGGPIRKREYYRDPDLFRPVLTETLVPYVDVLIHCIYWDSRFPVLLTAAGLRAMRAAGRQRLLAIADVTCDVDGGSIDFSCHATSIDAPFYSFDPATGERRPGAVAGGEGSVVVLAVDNLPSELPREASDHFGDALLPFLPPLGACPATNATPGEAHDDLPVELRNACIARGGGLTAPFTYISRLRAAREARESGGDGGDGGDGVEAMVSESVNLIGHLFDRGLINRALNIIEAKAARFRIAAWKLGHRHSVPSAVELHVHARSKEDLASINRELEEITPLIDPSAEMTIAPLAPEGEAGGHDAAPPSPAAGAEMPVRGGKLYQMFMTRPDDDGGGEGEGEARGVGGGGRAGAPGPGPYGHPGETTRVREWTMATLAGPLGPSRKGLPPHRRVAREHLRPPAFGHGHAAAAPATHVQHTLVPAPVPESTVLVLGAGFCARPLVERLAARVGTQVVLASLLLPDLERVTKGVPGVQTAVLDPTRDKAALAGLIEGADAVVSMLPAPLHPAVARECVAAKKHLVTASYVSAEMRALEADAVNAGVVLLNECGLDPGIDHVTAVSAIRAIQAKGGRVVKFTSMCGGLPAPEAADNPIGYKFSWSPRGVLVAGLQPALYRWGGETVSVPSEELMASAKRWDPPDLPAFLLDVLPNRDSLRYADAYGIQDAETVMRGTFRYPGFSDVMLSLGKAGLLSTDPHPALAAGAPRVSWASFTAAAAAGQAPVEDAVPAGGGAPAENAVPGEGAAAVARLVGAAGLDEGCARAAELRGALAWLGVAGGDLVPQEGSPLDAVCALLEAHPGLKYSRGERDMVIMRHELEVEWPGGGRESHTSTLIHTGDGCEGVSAMSKTVGLCAAAATELILDGRLEGVVGVKTPSDVGVAAPLLATLDSIGIRMVERVTKL